MNALIIALIIVAAILAGIELWRTKTLLAIAVLVLALALLLPTLAAL